MDAAHPGAAISPSMFGIFFEDINFGADGGLYPELVKNRSFEFQQPLTGWHEVLGFSGKGLDRPKGELGIRTEEPLNETNPHYLRVRVYEPGYGFYNSGFRGMGVESGAEYRFSVFVRSDGPKAIRAVLLDGSGHEIGSGKLEGFDRGWKKYETVIRANATVRTCAVATHRGRNGNCRSRHGFAVPSGYMEAPAEWIAQRPGAIAG